MKDYLPIGSVVKLKNSDKKLMIVGFSQVRETEKIERADYVSVLYPAGVFCEDCFMFFNAEDISETVFTGYDDEDRKEFLELVDTAEKMIENKIKTAASNNNEFD